MLGGGDAGAGAGAGFLWVNKGQISGLCSWCAVAINRLKANGRPYTPA